MATKVTKPSKTRRKTKPKAARQELPFTKLLAIAEQQERAKQALTKGLRKSNSRLPYPTYTELTELMATFKVESGDQPVWIRFNHPVEKKALPYEDFSSLRKELV